MIRLTMGKKMMAKPMTEWQALLTVRGRAHFNRRIGLMDKREVRRSAAAYAGQTPKKRQRIT